jgi:hypothetical protein
MCTHFNIGKKIEVNPFENVKFVRIADHCMLDKFISWLHKQATSVETRKVNDQWVVLFDVELLDFTTLLQWYAPYRGKFYFKSQSVQFLIEDDIMICW